MKKWILLGANGQLGSEWQYQLSKKEDAVDMLSYNSSQLDITDFRKVEDMLSREQPDIIINCAAYTKVDLAEKEKKKAEHINSIAVRNLAALCKKYRSLLVHYSTDYIFSGDKDDRIDFPSGYTEEHNASPANWYGMTKWKGEKAIKASGCRYLIIRLSWLCGAYGKNFVTAMRRLSETKSQLKVVNDQLSSPTFTRNVVLNTLNLIKQKRQGIYHLSCSGLISWADFAKAIFNILNIKVDVLPVDSSQFPTEAKRPCFSKLNTKKIEAVEGSQIISWRKGLQRLLDDMS